MCLKCMNLDEKLEVIQVNFWVDQLLTKTQLRSVSLEQSASIRAYVISDFSFALASFNHLLKTVSHFSASIVT